MITIEHLTKTYGSVDVVKKFSLEVASGESVALWGPNGAGKTTVVRCILGLVRYEGTITVDGLDAKDRGKVCIVGRNPDALWFDDYEDRVLFDEAGLFDYVRVKKLESEVPVSIGVASAD